MRFFPVRKSSPVLSSSKYMDMESSPSLLPSDESSGSGSISDEPPRLGPLRSMRRGGSFHKEEPPRLAHRKTVLRGTQDPPQVTPPRRKAPPGSLDEASTDEMRRVLREVGAIEQKKGIVKGWSARRPKEGRFSKEPVWKRRLRKLKASLVPEQAAAQPTAIVKSVSFDDVSLNHPSAADGYSPERKKKAQTPEDHKPSPFKRVGSSFSDFFRKVAEEDLFSLDTPSYWSEQTSMGSITTADDDTTIASYGPRMKVPMMECKKPASCNFMNQDEKTNYGCSSGDSVVDDLRLVADLLISDATCRTFMTDEAIPQRRGNTESS